MSVTPGESWARRWVARPRLLALVIGCALLATTAGLVTRGFGAWVTTSTNTPSTVGTDVIIVPVVTSTHPSATGGTVSLSWTEPISWVQGYHILRATTPAGTYSQIGSVAGASTTTYSDGTAAYNSQYYYEIQPYYDLWNNASAVDMALSLPPTSGSDGTGATPATLSAAQLTAMSTTSGGGYTTAGAWGTQTLFGGGTADGVTFPTSAAGWVVTQSGTIYHSTDGGETWAQQTSGTTQALYSTKFTDVNNGWAVGAAGTLLHTSNGGTTWGAQTSGTAQALISTSFTDANNGWAVGAAGTILRTSNGGTTWSAQTSGSTQVLYGVTFIDSSNGWVVGAAGTILHTSNGGTTWGAQTSGTAQIVYGVTFSDASNGWAVGATGTILHTSNSGTTWSAQTSGTAQILYAVRFVDASHGWAVGAGGTILFTSNAGATWTAQTNTGTTTYAVAATDTTHAWTPGSGVLYLTTDGSTWTAPTTQYLSSGFSPTVAVGSPVSSAKLTFEYQSSKVPGAGTQTYALVMPGNGTTWTVFSLPIPIKATYQTVTTDVSGVINSAAALQGMQVRFVVSQQSTSNLSTTTELVHLDIN